MLFHEGPESEGAQSCPSDLDAHLLDGGLLAAKPHVVRTSAVLRFCLYLPSRRRVVQLSVAKREGVWFGAWFVEIVYKKGYTLLSNGSINPRGLLKDYPF